MVAVQADAYNHWESIFVLGWIAALLGFTTLALAAPFMVIRGIACWLLREHWNTRYIRFSFDVALIGLIVLCEVTFLPEHGVGGHLTSFMREKIEAGDRLYNLQRARYGDHTVGCYWPEPLSKAESKLETIVTLSWFLERFPLYVILPGGIFFLAGYSSERARKIKVSGKILSANLAESAFSQRS
jgi:hypothetical protein